LRPPPKMGSSFCSVLHVCLTNVERRGRRGGSPWGGKGRQGCLRPSAGTTASGEGALLSLGVLAHRSSVRPQIQLREIVARLGGVPPWTACRPNGSHDCTRGTPPPWSQGPQFSLTCALSLSGVGKSSILLRFTDDSFAADQPATIGVDFKVHPRRTSFTPSPCTYTPHGGYTPHEPSPDPPCSRLPSSKKFLRRRVEPVSVREGSWQLLPQRHSPSSLLFSRSCQVSSAQSPAPRAWTPSVAPPRF